MKQLFIFLFLLEGVSGYSTPKVYKVSSPDGKIVLTVNAGTDIIWSAAYQGMEIIKSLKAGLVPAIGKTLGENVIVSKATYGKTDQVLEPVVPHKHSRIEDKCNTLLVTFRSGFAINFRVYNDGIAYRFETAIKGDIIIKNEISNYSSLLDPDHGILSRRVLCLTMKEDIFIHQLIL